MIHYFGENLEDVDDEYINKNVLSPTDLVRIQNREKNISVMHSREYRAELLKSKIPKLGPFQTFFTLMKAFVGIAMLLFPNGYFNAGWLFGTFSILIISFLILVSLNLLLTVSEENEGSFSALGEKCLGKPGKYFCD